MTASTHLSRIVEELLEVLFRRRWEEFEAVLHGVLRSANVHGIVGRDGCHGGGAVARRNAGSTAHSRNRTPPTAHGTPQNVGEIAPSEIVAVINIETGNK